MTNDMKSVCITHKGLYVTFYSSDNEEIDDIENCFGHFWTVCDASDAVEGWSVVSHQVSSIKDIIDINELKRSPTGLFKYAPVKKIVINKKHYYVHDLEWLDCLTCFDLETKTTHFYHEHKLNEYSYIRNLVREPLAAHYKELGYITMHTSACSINDKGILMPGLKGAGKSTLLCHLLESGASYIGNDAVLCNEESDSIILTVLPQCMRLSEKTVQNNKSLINYHNNHKEYFYNSINSKFEILPKLLDSIFSKHHSSFSSKLELIIIPSIDLSRTDYSIEISDENSGKSILEKSIFYPCHNYTWSPFFNELNDPLIDVNNFSNVFRSIPKVCNLKYGILDNRKQRQLYSDLENIIES